MEQLAEPSWPVPLPRPLSDPLRGYRWLLFFTVPLLWLGLIAQCLAYLLPDVRKTREAAHRMQVQNNLKQIELALRNYSSDYDARPPAANVDNSWQRFLDSSDVSASKLIAGAERGPSGDSNHIEPKAAPAAEAVENVGPSNIRSESKPEPTESFSDKVGVTVGATSITLLLCALCVLPRRATNALYLRSFRNDAATGSLRVAAQAALGRGFRLSGIRDPRRRWPVLLRHLLYILFLVRYAHPRFMNLEAGHDWKARLWRSLGESRCALIDVSDLTPFVREEIELAVQCLGLHRILFIGNGSRTTDEWRQAILTALGSPNVPRAGVQVAIWDDSTRGQASFKGQVRVFADRLPAAPPGPNLAAFPETESSTVPDSNAVTDETWRPFLFATLIGIGIIGAMIWTQVCLLNASMIWHLPLAIYNTLAALLLVQFIAECSSWRERLRIGVTFFFAAAFTSLPVFAVLWNAS